MGQKSTVARRDSNPGSNRVGPHYSKCYTHIHGLARLCKNTYISCLGHDDASSVSFVWANACALLPRPVSGAFHAEGVLGPLLFRSLCPDSCRPRSELLNEVLYVFWVCVFRLKMRCRGKKNLPGLRPGPRDDTPSLDAPPRRSGGVVTAPSLEHTKQTAYVGGHAQHDHSAYTHLLTCSSRNTRDPPRRSRALEPAKGVSGVKR